MLLHLFLGLLDDLLDPGRVDPAVLDQLFQRDLAISRRTLSKPVTMTMPGRVVDDHVDAGGLLEARMFRPSRPMIRPFMSSVGMSTVLTVVSAVCDAAYRWMAVARISRAFCWQVSRSVPLVLEDQAADLVRGVLLERFGGARSRASSGLSRRCAVEHVALLGQACLTSALRG